MTDKNIYQRINSVMEEVAYVQKDKPRGMQYSIVSHDAVTAKVRPVLVKHGVVYHPVKLSHTQNGNRTEVQMDVRFVNIDKPEEYFDVPVLGYGIDTQDKGPGKAISYAVKYALLKALGLETGDDADNESIEHQVAPDPVDMERVNTAVEFFKEKIDIDDIEENHDLIQAAYDKLTSDEKTKVNDKLKTKAPDGNKYYSTLLKEYLDYIPQDIPGL